jgi:protein TonB
MSAAYRLPATLDHSTRRRRATGLALAIGVELLVVLALLGLGVERPVPMAKNGTLRVDLIPNAEEDVTQTRRQRPRSAKRATPVTPPRFVPPPPRIKLPTPPADHSLPMIILTQKDLETADIKNLGSKGVPSPAQDSGSDAQLADGAGDTARVGTGPNGQPLYAAEWYREPTDRELSGYLPPRMPDGGGWGLVACRTAARYHVEDCVELGNSPPGSHLASAVRQAAWQFLVRPPRKGGRDMVGEWVRIRIDYLQGSRLRVE